MEDSKIEIRWHQLLADFYGKRLSRDDAERWVAIFKKDLPGITEGELIDAITWSRDNYKRKSKFQPDYTEVKDMVDKYRDLRRHERGIFTQGQVKIIRPVWSEDGGHEIQYTYTDMASLKRLLNKSPPPEVAWEIICCPSEADQCRELEHYCQTHNITYERFDPDYSEIKRKVAKIGRAA